VLILNHCAFVCVFVSLCVVMVLVCVQRERTVFRLTLVKAWNDDEVRGYCDLVKIGKPDFIEIKVSVCECVCVCCVCVCACACVWVCVCVFVLLRWVLIRCEAGRDVLRRLQGIAHHDEERALE
jgi:hypothetical protein